MGNPDLSDLRWVAGALRRMLRHRRAVQVWFLDGAEAEARAHPDHPYAHVVVGYVDLLRRFSRDD